MSTTEGVEDPRKAEGPQLVTRTHRLCVDQERGERGKVEPGKKMRVRPPHSGASRGVHRVAGLTGCAFCPSHHARDTLSPPSGWPIGLEQPTAAALHGNGDALNRACRATQKEHTTAAVSIYRLCRTEASRMPACMSASTPSLPPNPPPEGVRALPKRGLHAVWSARFMVRGGHCANGSYPLGTQRRGNEPDGPTKRFP